MSYNLAFPIRGLVAGVMLACGSIGTAYSATLDLSYSATADGIIGDGTVTTINTSDPYTYSHAFTDLPTVLHTPSSGPDAGTGFNFYDDYIFTVGTGILKSVTASFNVGNLFGIDNLSARLYIRGSDSLPVLETPTGFTSDGSKQQFAGLFGDSTNVAILDNVPLAAGTYVLEIRGTVSGIVGGGYNGVLTAEPAAIPLPGAALFMGSAILGLTVARRRK